MELVYKSTKKEIFPYNRVEISVEDAKKLNVKTHYRVLLKPKLGKGKAQIGEVFVCDNTDKFNHLEKGEISFNLSLKNELLHKDNVGNHIIAESIPVFNYNKIRRTSGTSPKSGVVGICREDYLEWKKLKAKTFKIINGNNGEVYDVPFKYVTVEENLKKSDGVIKLNKWIRNNLFINEVGTTSEFDANIIIQPSGKYRRSFWEWLKQKTNTLLGFITGNKEIELSCCRPFDNDEMSNVIRLSSDNMILLGIEEGDNVFISYKNRYKKVKVLLIDKEHYKVNESTDKNDVSNEGKTTDQSQIYTDISEHIDHYVGIPRFTRKEMKINNLGRNIKIVRNSFFIMFKNAVLSFFTILSFIFTVASLDIIQGKYKWIVALVLTPIILSIVLIKEKMKVK